MDISKPIGMWLVTGDIHDGERSRVYKVRHVNDPKRIAALKICTDAGGESVREFLTEIDNTRLRLLEERMPEVLDAGEHEGMPYFVMPYSESVDMTRRSAAFAVRVAVFLVECCIELRRKGYVHGDLKPENVGIEIGTDGDRRFVLRDWATLRGMAEANVRSGVVGTRYYRSQTVDYTGRCDERSEIHAVGMTFLALLPLVKRIVYGPAILLAISPHMWPFVQVRTYEELRRLIERSPGSFRRLVWLKAAVWKTSIVTRWTTLGVTCVVAVCGVMFGCHLYDDYKARHAEVRREFGPKDNVMGLVRSGIIQYRLGDFVGAYQRLKAGRGSRLYSPADFKEADVEDIFEDCRRRVSEMARRGW